MKKYLIAAPILIILVLVVALQLRGIRNRSKTLERTAARRLDKNYAEYRADLISELQYALNMDITHSDKFSGSVKIDFTLKKVNALTLDFFNGEVSQVLVNGKKLDEIIYNNFFINLPRASLQPGKNTVEVNFAHAYGQTGTGLYRFIDPEDKNAYLYSDFEPYDANDMFPCFDQPDLKGTYQSVILAPKGWQVVSTTMETERTVIEDNEQWTFPVSNKIATYVYSLHAGPYMVWTSEAKTPNQTIPLRLFARQSLAKYVDPAEWFTTTQQGFNFYETYFDFPYPYLKYDQLIVPDFNSGAMENVGAVTFNEKFLSRGVKQRYDKRRLAEVILHEMAHMWFGDLVTMKWWNDIWLNESFATYISTRALMAGTPYTESWVDFASTDKQRAYWEDQLVTTHPIEFSVPDTEVVFANFDGITYGKGASVLKQLAFYLGETGFQKGLQNYFKYFAYGNATLAEFTNQLTVASTTDLTEWESAWLKKAQVNTIKVSYTCADGKIATAKLEQTAPAGFNHMRPHKTRIGIFRTAKNKLKGDSPVDFSYSGPSQDITPIIGQDCANIALVYPNMEDYDYVKVELDELSLSTAQERLAALDDEILRIGLWTSLWDMVEAQKIPVTQYLQIFLKNSAQEKSADVLRGPLERVISIAHDYLPPDDAWKVQRTKWIAQLSAHFLKATRDAVDPDMQKTWFDYYVKLAEQPEDLKLLAETLAHRPAWLKFDVDQERRWNVVKTLNQYAFGSYQKLADEEKVKDPTDLGLKAASAAEVSRPDMQVKKDFWKKIAEGPSEKMSLGQLRPIISNIFPSEQRELQKEFRQDFYKSLRDLSGKPSEFLGTFAQLAPDLCATDSVNELKDFAAKNQDLPATVIKRLKVRAQEGERCVGIRAKAAAAQLL